MINCDYMVSNGILISLICVDNCCIGSGVNYCFIVICLSIFIVSEDNLLVL